MRELARKLPVRGFAVRLEAETERALLRAVARGVQQREIGRTGTMREVDGIWMIPVERLKPPRTRPSWTRPVVYGIAGAGGLLALILLAVKLVSLLLAALATALMATLPWVFGGALVLAVAGALGGGSVIEILQKVTIKR